MLLIPIIAAATIGGASAPMMPIHISTGPMISAPAAPRPISAPPATQPVHKSPPTSAAPVEKKIEVARQRLPDECVVSRNVPGVGALYGIAVAPPSPRLACPPPDIVLPPLLQY